MDSLIVGESEITRIVNAIATSSSFSTLKGHLFNIALKLGVDYDSQQSQAQRLLGIITSDSEPLKKILESWKQKKGQTATVAAFVAVLRESTLIDFADCVTAEFSEETKNLQQAATTASEPLSQMDSIDPDDMVYLDIKVSEMQYRVLNTIQPDFITILTNADINKNAILQLNRLELFDHPETDRLLGNFDSEQARLIQLFRILRNQEPNDIKECLELLCNLEGAPAARKKIRKCFAKNFLGSVKKVPENK